MNRKHLAASTLFALLLALLTAAPGLAESLFEGHWEGRIETPGQPLEIDVDFESCADDTLSGDISIPVQGIRDLDLTAIVADGRVVRFEIPGIPGEPSFEGELAEDGKQIAGTFR